MREIDMTLTMESRNVSNDARYGRLENRLLALVSGRASPSFFRAWVCVHSEHDWLVIPKLTPSPKHVDITGSDVEED